MFEDIPAVITKILKRLLGPESVGGRCRTYQQGLVKSTTSGICF